MSAKNECIKETPRFHTLTIDEMPKHSMELPETFYKEMEKTRKEFDEWKAKMDEMRLVDANEFEVVGYITPCNADPVSYCKGVEFVLGKLDSAPTIDPETLPIVKELREKLKKEQKLVKTHIKLQKNYQRAWSYEYKRRKAVEKKLARYEQAEIESKVYKDTGASGPWVTSDGEKFWWDAPEYSDLSNKNPWEVTNEEFGKADSAAYERAIAHKKELMENKNKKTCGQCVYYNGGPGDGVQFCDSKEEYVSENGYCSSFDEKERKTE